MSRTVRRKNQPKCHYVWEDRYTHEEDHYWVMDWEQGRWLMIAQRPERKTGKEYWKGWWKFHNDTLNFHNKRNRSTWSEVRRKNREDLNKWARCEDHEPIFFEEVNHQEWL
jgi:hypothetical protein